MLDNNLSNVITVSHPASPYIKIVDENDKPIPYIVEYNNNTKVAKVYKGLEFGEPLIESKHLPGSRIVFKLSQTDI